MNDLVSVQWKETKDGRGLPWSLSGSEFKKRRETERMEVRENTRKTEDTV